MDAFSNSSVRNGFREELKVLQNNARQEAKKNGRASRIARKYNSNSNKEEIMTVEAGGLKDESDSDSDEGEDVPIEMQVEEKKKKKMMMMMACQMMMKIKLNSIFRISLLNTHKYI